MSRQSPTDNCPITLPERDRRRADCQCLVGRSFHQARPILSPGVFMTCGFVPPYLLRHLAAGAGGARGSKTLELDQRLRARRAAVFRYPAEKQQLSLAPADGTRSVHTAAGSEDLPGAVARGDGDPATGDPAVDEAYESSGQVLDL